MPSLFPDLAFAGSGADFDPTRAYRYRLWRTWRAVAAPRLLMCLMLNPSTADEHVLDPTIRRCVGYARRWGFDGLEVCNIFAWRSTDPRALYDLDDPIGPANDEAIVTTAKRCELVIAAWGNHGALRDRGRAVADLLHAHGVALKCLRHTKAGHPEHPLYLPKTLTPIPIWSA